MSFRPTLMPVMLVLLCVAGLGVVTSHVPYDPFADDYGSDFLKDGSSNDDIKSSFTGFMQRLQDIFSHRSLDDQGDFPAGVTMHYTVAGDDDTASNHTDHTHRACLRYFTEIFHKVGHPLNTTALQLNAHALSHACRVLKSLGIIPGLGAAVVSANFNTTDQGHGHGQGQGHSQGQGHGRNPHSNGGGTTVKEPSLDLVKKLEDLVGGSQHDDNSDSDRDFMSLQDLFDRKFNISSKFG
ncbi:hypothetical protein ElyMa_003601600 [Elysia marginata]|uniref:Uncharacterized protein n=1 Tax=Elysia marginata TaxID=1093978 RepID=A0AAV4ERR5_9GAST|nr:hypothetical protein ElyMa_003601600 [Elysia marginata]